MKRISNCWKIGLLAALFWLSQKGQSNGPTLIPIATQKIQGEPRTAASATKVLQAALTKSGVFKTVGNPAGVVSTRATLSKEGMDATLLGADGKKIFAKAYRRGNAELDALQFADDITLTLTKIPGIATSQIIFVVNRKGQRQLFVCDFDGRHARPLVNTGETNVAPAISENGKQLAFAGLNRGVGQLMLFDIENQQMEALVAEPIHFAQSAWSPDGKSLAVAMAKVPEKSADLFLIRLRGRRAPKKIIETPVSESQPAWSPDGKTVIYAAPIGSNQSGLFLAKVLMPKPSPKPFPTGLPNTSAPDWSPDGEKIAFTSTDARGKKSICIAFPKGGKPAQKLTAGFDPVWGANSRHLVFSTGTELRILDTFTGKASTLVRGIGSISEPTWTR